MFVGRGAACCGVQSTETKNLCLHTEDSNLNCRRTVECFVALRVNELQLCKQLQGTLENKVE